MNWERRAKDCGIVLGPEYPYSTLKDAEKAAVDRLQTKMIDQNLWHMRFWVTRCSFTFDL